MREVPAVTPVIIPVVDPAVATVVLLLLHRPPPTPSVSVVVRPVHIDVIPVIGVGEELTVTVVVVEHPVGNV
jgi:hypothetical protein